MAISGTFGELSKDLHGTPTQAVSTQNWRARSVAVSAGAWTELGDGSSRNHLMVYSIDTNASKVILAHTNLSATSSNDLTSDLCGVPLAPGASLPFTLTGNIPVYARVVAAGAAGRLYLAEAL